MLFKGQIPWFPRVMKSITCYAATKGTFPPQCGKRGDNISVWVVVGRGSSVFWQENKSYIPESIYLRVNSSALDGSMSS